MLPYSKHVFIDANRVFSLIDMDFFYLIYRLRTQFFSDIDYPKQSCMISIY